MEKTNSKNIFIRVILFLIIGCVLFQFISSILLPEWIDDSDVTLSLRGFYNEPKDTIDVIFLGNSNVYRGVSPMVLWEQKGISSYSLSSPIQKMWLSYYILKECFVYQKPKVVVLDVDEIFTDALPDEAFTRKALDNMKLGKVKWEAMNDPIFENTTMDKLSYVFPILRYHTRWNQVKERDFTRFLLRYHSQFKGYLPTKQTKPYSKKVNYMQKQEKKEESDIVKENSKQYLEKIKALCKENGTQLVLVELPTVRTWSYGKNQAMKQYAQEQGLPFIDLNEQQEVGINWETDTEDEGYHLNKNGAQKVSAYLTNYLTQNYVLPNHQQEASYQKWNEHLKAYINQFEQEEKK